MHYIPYFLNRIGTMTQFWPCPLTSIAPEVMLNQCFSINCFVMNCLYGVTALVIYLLPVRVINIKKKHDLFIFYSWDLKI